MSKESKIVISDSEQQEYNRLKDKFKSYYSKEIVPYLSQQEAIRRKHAGNFWVLLIVAFIVLPISGGIFYFLGKYIDNDFGKVIFVVLCFLFIYLMRSPFKKYRQEVKNDVMGLFIKFFQGFGYHQGQSLNKSLMERSQIFPPYDVLKANSCFNGRYNDIGITVCEQTLQTTTEDSSGKQIFKNVFHGLAIEMDVKRPFPVQILLVPNNISFVNLQNISDMAELEDDILGKDFTIYATNTEEAKNILNADFINRAIGLQNICKGKNMHISFYANKILLCVETTSDMFAIGSLFKSNLDRKKFDKAFEQMWSIFLIANALKTD